MRGWLTALVSAGTALDGARESAPPQSRALRVAASALMAASAEDVHLAEWLFALTDEEFRAVSAAHIALGHCSREFDAGIVTVETVSRIVVVTHFREEIARANHIRVRSTDSRAYGFTGRVSRVELVWDLAVHPAGLGRSELHSAVILGAGSGARFPKARARPLEPVRTGLGTLGLGRAGLRPLVRGIHAHLLHETRGFAADIEKKFGRRAFLGLAQ